MVSKSWIINFLKTFKISDEVIRFNEETTKTLSAELTAEWKSFAEKKIQRGIFQRHVLSPLLYIIGMMPLNNIFRKCLVGYR